MAGHREHRKALPGRKLGEPWEPEAWEAFKAWALQNGANIELEGRDDEFIVWVDDGGFQHREGGPALVALNGEEGWYRHGHPHREDGPAIIFSLTIPKHNRPRENQKYWLDGVHYTDETFTEKYYK